MNYHLIYCTGLYHTGINGIEPFADSYVVIELDSYGHYFHKVRTKMVVKSTEPHWEEDFSVELEGTRGLRILLYEEDCMQTAVLRGKAEIEVLTFLSVVSIFHN